jgi:hypothetical protein
MRLARYSAHILKHHGLGLAFFDYPKCFGEQIPFVAIAELLACLGKRRAGDTASKQVNPAKIDGLECPQVAFKHIPVGAVHTQGSACPTINLNQALMAESCKFKTQRLTSCPSADLDGIQHMPLPLG